MIILELKDIHNCDNEGLEECLSKYGGYKSYLESQLAYIDAKSCILKTSFEESLAKKMYLLEEEYADSKKKKPNQIALRGEVLFNNPSLEFLRKTANRNGSILLAVLKG